MANESDLDALLFVDTNVLLDFYRIQKSDIRVEYLAQLETCKDRLIIGSQIEMEYKKNRQSVILRSLANFGTVDWSKLSGPALISDFQPVKMIEKKKKELQNQISKGNSKIQKILSDPIRHDRVYQCLQRVFKNKSPYNLSRNQKMRFKIRRLARKRFILGYPPRKHDDTSIGDAINWEWIINCSKESGKHIVLVTRDTDFGVIYKRKSYLNDWLKQEFNERTSKKRKIILTDKLSYGLKLIHGVVTQEMEEEENRLIAEMFDDLEQLEDEV